MPPHSYTGVESNASDRVTKPTPATSADANNTCAFIFSSFRGRRGVSVRRVRVEMALGCVSTELGRSPGAIVVHFPFSSNNHKSNDQTQDHTTQTEKRAKALVVVGVVELWRMCGVRVGCWSENDDGEETRSSSAQDEPNTHDLSDQSSHTTRDRDRAHVPFLIAPLPPAQEQTEGTQRQPPHKTNLPTLFTRPRHASTRHKHSHKSHARCFSLRQGRQVHLPLPHCIPLLAGRRVSLNGERGSRVVGG